MNVMMMSSGVLIVFRTLLSKSQLDCKLMYATQPFAHFVYDIHKTCYLCVCNLGVGLPVTTHFARRVYSAPK